MPPHTRPRLLAGALLPALLAGPAPAEEAPPRPGAEFPAIPVTPYARVVPKGERRTIGFFTSLDPDCSVQGPIVARLTSPPRHGSVAFVGAEGFPRYGPSSPLSACNAKRVSGLRMEYQAGEGHEGLDAFRALLILPEGSAYELDVKVSVR